MKGILFYTLGVVVETEQKIIFQGIEYNIIMSLQSMENNTKKKILFIQQRKMTRTQTNLQNFDNCVGAVFMIDQFD